MRLNKSLLLALALVFVTCVCGILPVWAAPTYTYGVTQPSSTSALFWFKPDTTASYVILHYTKPGLVQQNIYMTYNSGAARWEYTVTGLVTGNVITYNYTYNISGVQYDTPTYTYTVGSTATATPTQRIATLTPTRRGTPTRRVTPTPTRRGTTPTPTQSGSYMYNNLVWSDEFDGTALNRSNWNYQIGNGYNPGSSAFDGWGNGEWEWYREANVSVSGGNLVIKGEYSSTPFVFNGQNWYQFSGRITTKNLRSWKYARVEARIKVPPIVSTWPAFWMMGNACDSTVNGGGGGYDKLPTNWASCGEIDIMEHKNADSQICSNYFYDTRTGVYPWASDTNANAPTWTGGVDISQYHTYAVEWNSSTLKYYLDGRVIKTVSVNASNQEEFHTQNWFVILNMAISGTFTGPTTPNQADFPCYMYVDYVRVYQ
ncbi:MAG TPA: glycoside hydrolase family 16 protein [Bacillota bacterium]|nr:glycoside hydrolase family 16 protein [Bacillota bacterium]